MNVNDSEKIAGILESRGYQKTDKPEDADVIIVNTCTVREKPDNKALSFIGSLKSLKKKKKLKKRKNLLKKWQKKKKKY